MLEQLVDHLVGDGEQFVWNSEARVRPISLKSIVVVKHGVHSEVDAVVAAIIKTLDDITRSR
jgi:hypothetical protein